LRNNFTLWFSDNHSMTSASGNIKSPKQLDIAQWVEKSMGDFDKEIITNSFKNACITDNLDGSESMLLTTNLQRSSMFIYDIIKSYSLKTKRVMETNELIDFDKELQSATELIQEESYSSPSDVVVNSSDESLSIDSENVNDLSVEEERSDVELVTHVEIKMKKQLKIEDMFIGIVKEK
jgi:hypothetical protein